MGGEDAAIATAALRFADQLGARYGIEVHQVDERLSSREAEDSFRELRRSGAKVRRVRRGDVDREAARLLRDPERYRPLWRAEWERVQADITLLDAGGATIDDEAQVVTLRTQFDF